MNNAELIVATLRAAGVSHGFGIPSGNVLPLIEAMRVGRLPYVLTAHEGSAAFMADVMGRLTGAPGLCIATLGPGATNLTTGVGNAYLDRSPLLAITCNVPTSQLGRRIQMAIGDRSPSASLRVDHHGQGHGPGGSPALPRLHRAGSAPGAAGALAQRRSRRGARLRRRGGGV